MYRFRSLPGLLLMFVLASCGDRSESLVQEVVTSGGDHSEAIMDLVLSKADVIPALIPALQDTSYPTSGRADLVEVGRKLFLRDSDPRILAAFQNLIDDPRAEVRAGVARSFGHWERSELIHPLMRRLQVEEQEDVLLQILVAVEMLGTWREDYLGNTGAFKISGGDQLSEEEREVLLETTRATYEEAASDSLRQQAQELLEKLVAQVTQEGDKLALKADLAGAEEQYLRAAAYSPRSKNALMRLAKFYLQNGEIERGLDTLAAHGMLVRAPRFKVSATIDGRLDEPVWSQAARVDSFYRLAHLMRPVPSSGRTEAWLGYTDSALCFAVKGYEEDTSTLSAKHEQRDGAIWRDDDSMALFLDTNFDQRVYYQIYVNSIGATMDRHIGADLSKEASIDYSWDPEIRLGVRIEPTYWIAEIEIPFDSLVDVDVKEGDIWGLNVGRLRVAHGGESLLWAPTYGLLRRPSRYGVMIFQ